MRRVGPILSAGESTYGSDALDDDGSRHVDIAAMKVTHTCVDRLVVGDAPPVYRAVFDDIEGLSNRRTALQAQRPDRGPDSEPRCTPRTRQNRTCPASRVKLTVIHARMWEGA